MEWSEGNWKSQIDDAERTEAMFAINLIFKYEEILNKLCMKFDVKGEQINWFRSTECSNSYKDRNQ